MTKQIKPEMTLSDGVLKTTIKIEFFRFKNAKRIYNIIKLMLDEIYK